MTMFLLAAGGFVIGWIAAAMLYRARRRQRYQSILGRQGILK